MKAIFALLVSVFVVYVVAENCPNNNPQVECTHETCGNGLTISCVNNTCTCTANAFQCITKAECESSNIVCNRDWHCFDNRCRCGFFPGGGR